MRTHTSQLNTHRATTGIGAMLSPLLLLAMFVLTPAHAAVDGAETFTEKRFKALQAQDALILVDISAEWCPTCKQQAKVIEQYKQANADVDLHVLTVDFDDQKKWVKHFKAPRQSTLIIYKGDKRVWFSVAETSQDKIFAALNDAADNV